ncbi:MAG: N-acetylgalactosamine-6-sulfatase [Opitutae bacterium]|nr:N-acetylgalactosamine-6-sulfatase [Opitutae bacterium]
MKKIITLAFFLLLIGSLHAAHDKPNIIYIVSDDLGYGDLGSYGQKEVKTPRLDQMAKEGLRFTDHYAGHTVCRPSRLVFLTGKHTGHTAIAGNNMHVLPKGTKTVTSLLKEAGYVTAGIGKWALGNVGTSGHPNNQGFDFFYGYLDQGAAHDYYPEFLFRNEKAERLPGNVNSGQRNVSSKKVTYAHTRITEEALVFIERNKAKPFYLNLTWTIPHTNNEAGRVEKDGQEVPDYGIYADRDWPNPEKGFAAMVTLMDEDTGKIIDLLKKLGIEKRTLLVFTSDNGPHQEGGHKVDFFNSNGELKGYKRSLHDGGIRVPMIAWWPGTVKPGVTDLPSAFWDWLPTACELGGAEIPTDIDGISFAPTLLGQKAKQKKHEYLFWRWSGFRAVRMGQWKGVQTNKDLALYDLDEDLGEENDVAKDHPKLAARIKEIIDELE